MTRKVPRRRQRMPTSPGFDMIPSLFMFCRVAMPQHFQRDRPHLFDARGETWNYWRGYATKISHLLGGHSGPLHVSHLSRGSIAARRSKHGRRTNDWLSSNRSQGWSFTDRRFLAESHTAGGSIIRSRTGDWGPGAATGIRRVPTSQRRPTSQHPRATF
jgi:hypothetical protein